MKKLIILLLFACSFGNAQVRSITWSGSSGQDTAKMASRQWGVLARFITFSDGSFIKQDTIKASNSVANVLSLFRSASSAAVMKVDTLGAIAASVHLADTSSFNAAEVRKAIYISGATANDMYAVTIRNTSEILPVAADLSAAYAKTDSLVVNRAAGTTANLKFSYIRMKH